MNDVQQVALDDGLVDQLQRLLTDQVWTIAAITAVGMVVGIATTQFVKVFKPPLEDGTQEAIRARLGLYTRVAYVAGSIWTFLILLGVLTGGWLAKIVGGLGLAVIAGAGTPRMYDVLQWLWQVLVPAIGRWILDKVKTSFGRGGEPPAP